MIQTDKSHVIAELLLYASQTVIIKINTTITMRLNKAYGSAVGLLSFFSLLPLYLKTSLKEECESKWERKSI